MSVRIRYKIEVSVSSTSAEEKDLCNSKYEVVNDTQGEGGAWKTTVPVTTTALQLNLPNVATARFLLIRTNSKDPTLAPSPISIQRNTNTAETILIQPLGTSKEGHMLLATDGLMALYVTNPSATVDMEVTCVVAGD